MFKHKLKHNICTCVCKIYFNVLHTYNDIIDFSDNEKVPDEELSNLRHLSRTHIIRGLKLGDVPVEHK